MITLDLDSLLLVMHMMNTYRNLSRLLAMTLSLVTCFVWMVAIAMSVDLLMKVVRSADF